MMGGALDWRTLPAGRELDAVVAAMMEPVPEAISAHEARLRQWGPDPKRWTWYSVAYAESPDGWWWAHIGTDHGPDDHAPIHWFPAHDRTPSTDMAAAWLVVDELSARGYHVVVKSPFSPGDECHAGFTPHGVTGWNGRPDHRGSGDTAPLAIVRAALAAAEARP